MAVHIVAALDGVDLTGILGSQFFFLVIKLIVQTIDAAGELFVFHVEADQGFLGPYYALDVGRDGLSFVSQNVAGLFVDDGAFKFFRADLVELGPVPFLDLFFLLGASVGRFFLKLLFLSFVALGVFGFLTENVNVHDNAVSAGRNFQRGIANVSGLVAEDGLEQTLFGAQFGLALRSDLADQDVAGLDFGAGDDDTFGIQTGQGFSTHVRNVAGRFFSAQLGLRNYAVEAFDVHGSVEVLFQRSFGNDDSVFEVVAFPRHVSAENVASQAQDAVRGRRAVGDNIAGFDLGAGFDVRMIVYGGAGVGTFELQELFDLRLAVLAFYDNMSGVAFLDHAVDLGGQNSAGFSRHHFFQTCPDHRGFRGQKRHSLTLHVGTHQGSVGVVVFQEGDEACGDGDDLLRRNVDVFDFRGFNFFEVAVPAGFYAFFLDEFAVLVPKGVGLGDSVFFFFVSGQINDLVRHFAVFNFKVRRFHEAVLVGLHVRAHGSDKTDVGAFRSLNRTDAAVVAVVHVADFEAGAVSVQTAGAQC